MAIDKMNMDAMFMGGMGMEPGLGMDMGMAMGLGMNLDQCNMMGDCCEPCQQCCDCECEEVVRFNAAYLCPLGIIRLAIIVCRLDMSYFL